MSLIDDLMKDYERKQHEMGIKVKVGLIGQPGAGKSSLINKLVGEKVFDVGVSTDLTRDRQEKELDKIIVVDFPGYGTKMFSSVDDWVNNFQVDDIDLFLFVFCGKLLDYDSKFFDYLKKWQMERQHPHFIVRNKVDDIWDDDKSLDELKEEISKDVQSKMHSYQSKVYFTSCRPPISGIDELKEAIYAADIEGVKKSKLIYEFKATSKADLDRKKQICLDDLNWYGITGAANALNPIPGIDVSVDLGIMVKMFADIRATFNLSDDMEDKLKKFKILMPVANRVFPYATKAGVKLLVEKIGKQFISKEAAKYLPLVGQVFAAAAGYKMITSVGEMYVNDCYKLAEGVLNGFIDSK